MKNLSEAINHKHSCSCGGCTIENRTNDSAEPHTHHAEGCGCSHNKNEADPPVDDDHHHSAAADSCGCGHCNAAQNMFEDKDEHGHSHGEEKPPRLKWEITEIAASILIVAASMLLVENPILKAVLMIATIAVIGRKTIIGGIKGIFKLDFNELALMTIAVIAACAIGEYFEAYMVAMLFRIGEMLEDAAVAHSKREVEAITKIIPENANRLLSDGTSVTISAKELKLGEQILIKSGERIPVDCKVIKGHSSVDTSSITGESTPRDVDAGETLLSGMVNIGGILECETTSTFDNSTASRIIKMVRESAKNKGNTEKLISKFAKVYTPIVIVAAIAIAVLPPLLGFGSFTMWLGRSLVFLVASCPCALVIATPLSYLSGIGASSKNGILIKGSKYMEVLAHAQTVVMDKTGTLTTGSLIVSEYTSDEVLAIAAACEQYSNHPIAKAIVNAAENLKLPAVKNCREITSYGMQGEIDGTEVLCGSLRLMDKYGVDVSKTSAAVYVAKNGKLLGAVNVFDSPRDDARETMQQLKSMGVNNVVMLTGDSREAAEKTAKLIGITQIKSELLPQDKVAAFEDIKSKSTGKGTVLFVGDGINDSPVIARADAGIAMGMGSDAAIESADAVLLSNKLSSLPQAIRIAKRTGRLARFNITFALTIKLLVFFAAFFGIASMWMAVFADVGVTILSVLNSTRALRFK